jgi:phage tail sheath protein FI
MPRPGTDIVIVDALIPGGPSLDTGQAFFAGVSERGPVDKAVKLSSAKTYRNTFGERSGGSLLYDAVAAYFSEGGETLYAARVIGTGSDFAEGDVGTTLHAHANSPGTWGNDIGVRVEAPAALEAVGQLAGGGAVVVVSYDGVDVERSSVVADTQAAAAWSSSSQYVELETVGSDYTLPAAGATATLTGGLDGAATADSDLELALARFESSLGPGQVAAPGYTSSGAHDALLAHADKTTRCVLLDLPDDPDPLVASAAVTRLYGVPGARFAAAFLPWAEYPGPAAPSTVLVPYSGVQAGLIARSDALGNPSQPADGVNGISRMATGLSQSLSDDEREALNGIGVTTAKEVYGDVRTYGGRTVAGPDDVLWQWYGGSRTVMSISYEAGAIAENYVLRPIDGRGQLFAAFESDLRGMLLRYFTIDALYGATPSEAFAVDTGSSVNTPETIAAGEVHATIYVKTSPSAEYVRIDIVKVPVEYALPNAAAVAA